MLGFDLDDDGFAAYEWLGGEARRGTGSFGEVTGDPQVQATMREALAWNEDFDADAESTALAREFSAEDALARRLSAEDAASLELALRLAAKYAAAGDAASVALARRLYAEQLAALAARPSRARRARPPHCAALARAAMAAGRAPPKPLPGAWEDREQSLAVAAGPGVGPRVASREPPIRRRSPAPSTARRHERRPPARRPAAPPPRRSAVAVAVKAIVRTKAHADDVRSLARVVAAKQPQPGREGRGARRSARNRRQETRAKRTEKARAKKARRHAAAAEAEAKRIAAAEEARVEEARRRAAAADADAARVAAEAARVADERRRAAAKAQAERVAAAQAAREAEAPVRVEVAGAPSGAIAAEVERGVDEQAAAPADDARAPLARLGDAEPLLEEWRAPDDDASTASRPDAIDCGVVDEQAAAPADDARAPLARLGDAEPLLEEWRAPDDDASTASRPDAIDCGVVDEQAAAPADDARAPLARLGDAEPLLEKRRAPGHGAPTGTGLSEIEAKAINRKLEKLRTIGERLEDADLTDGSRELLIKEEGIIRQEMAPMLEKARLRLDQVSARVAFVDARRVLGLFVANLLAAQEARVLAAQEARVAAASAALAARQRTAAVTVQSKARTFLKRRVAATPAVTLAVEASPDGAAATTPLTHCPDDAPHDAPRGGDDDDAPCDHNNHDAPRDHNNHDAPRDHNNHDAPRDGVVAMAALLARLACGRVVCAAKTLCCLGRRSSDDDDEGGVGAAMRGADASSSDDEPLIDATATVDLGATCCLCFGRDDVLGGRPPNAETGGFVEVRGGHEVEVGSVVRVLAAAGQHVGLKATVVGRRYGNYYLQPVSGGGQVIITVSSANVRSYFRVLDVPTDDEDEDDQMRSMIDPQTAEVPRRGGEEEPTGDAMDESSSEDEASLDARIGRRVEIYWEKNDRWYPGDIVRQRPVDGDLELGVVYDDEPEKVHYHPFYQHPFAGVGAPPPAAEGDPVQWRFVTSKKRTKRPTLGHVASSGDDAMQLVSPEEGPPEAGSQGGPKKRKLLERTVNESEKRALMHNLWQGALRIVMRFNALKEEGNQRVCEAIEKQERLLADPLRASRRILLASADDETGLCEVKLTPLSSSERHSIELKRSSDADEPEATFVLDHVLKETQLKSGLRRGDILVTARLLRPGRPVPFVDVERELREALADRQAVTLIVRPTTSTTEATADAPHAQASNSSPPAANLQSMEVDQPVNDSEMQPANTPSAPQPAVGPDESTARKPHIDSWIQVYREDGLWYHGRVAGQSHGGDQLIIEYNNGETRPQLLCREAFTGDEVPPPPREGEPLPWCYAEAIVNWKLLRLPSPDALDKAKGDATSDLPEPLTDSHHMSDVGDGSDDNMDTETGSVLEEVAAPVPHRDGWRKPFQWRDLPRRAPPTVDDMREILTVFVPFIYCLNYTGVALASQTLGCTPVPVEFMGFCPRFHFMTMACAVLFGVSTGCLPIAYAEGLFKAMCISDLPAVQKWIRQRGMRGADDLPLDLLALIWAASACAWCRARGWKAWSEETGMQDGFFKRFCGAGIEGFGIPANLWMSGLWLPKCADPEGPLTASLQSYRGDTLFAFIRAIASGLNLTMPLLSLWAECTGRAKGVIRKAFDVSKAEAKDCTRFAHAYAHLNAQRMLNVFRKYRFSFEYSLKVAVEMCGPECLGDLKGRDQLTFMKWCWEAAEKGDLKGWKQFTFLKWCCWWPPWSNNPLPVAVTVFLPNTLSDHQCAEVIARLVSQQHDAAAPHYSEIFGWPCWWWDLRDNFSTLLSKPTDDCSPGATHEYRWWCWLWLAELQFRGDGKWELREKQLERDDVIAAKLDDVAPSDSELSGTNLEELANKSLRRLGKAPKEIYGDEVGDSGYLTLEFAIRQWLADVYGKPGPPMSLKTGVTGRVGFRCWETNPLIFNRDAQRDYPEADRKIGNALNVEVKVISGPEGKGANHDSNPLDFPVARHWQQGLDYAACRDDVSKAFLEASRKSYAAFEGFKFLLRNDELAMTDQARELIDNAPKQELKRTQRRTQTPSPRSTSLYGLLVQRLRDNDLELVDVDGDGNCQFRALAHQLFADEAHHAAVRQTVCNELVTHAERYSGFVEGTYDAFVGDMTLNAWGDHLTLQAAADAYNARITVVTTYEDEWRIRIDPTGPAPNGETPTTVCLGLIGEVHYVSVVPMSSNDESNVALPRGPAYRVDLSFDPHAVATYRSLPLAPGERRVVVEPDVGGSFGVLLDRGEGCAIVAGFASDDIAEKTSLRVGEVVVAADGRRLAGAAWDDIVARIGCCGRAGVPLELVVRKPNRGLAPGERRVVVEPDVGGSFGVLLDRGEGCAIVAGFASDDIAEKTSLRVGEVVVAADGRRLAGAAWDDIVARIRCCGRAGVPLELVVRKPNRGLDAQRPKKKRHRPSRNKARDRVLRRVPLTLQDVDALDWNEACEYAKAMGVSKKSHTTRDAYRDACKTWFVGRETDVFVPAKAPAVPRQRWQRALPDSGPRRRPAPAPAPGPPPAQRRRRRPLAADTIEASSSEDDDDARARSQPTALELQVQDQDSGAEAQDDDDSSDAED